MLPLEERGVLCRDRKGGSEMLAVRDQGALWMTCGPRGVDDEGWLLRPQLGDLARQPANIAIAAGRDERLVGNELIVREREERPFVDHYDAAERRQPVHQRQYAIDVLLVLGNEQYRAAIAHLVFDLLHRGGRIDAVDDGAQCLRR